MTSFRRFLAGLSGILATLGSAARVASATENRRSPAPGDLRRLGISVVAFGAINKA